MFRLICDINAVEFLVARGCIFEDVKEAFALVTKSTFFNWELYGFVLNVLITEVPF
jgi:hypothetical protein